MFGDKTTPGPAVHEAVLITLYFALTFLCLSLFIRAFAWIASAVLARYSGLYPLPLPPPGL